MTRDDLTRQALADMAALAERLADAARAATLPHFRAPALAVDNKAAGGFDPVTAADRAAEDAMRAILAQARPDDGIIGEERGRTPTGSGFSWVLDPIDGTRAFLCGAPSWGVLIALADGDGPFLGVIDQPFTRERFAGSPGYAQLRGPQGTIALGTRPTTRLADAILCTTFPEIGTTAERARFARVAAQCRLTRYGLDCYAYALLAAGHVDLVIEAGLAPYDIAAPIAVITAAGGVVTDWQGGPAATGGQVVAAATPALHAAALDRLAADG